MEQIVLVEGTIKSRCYGPEVVGSGPGQQQRRANLPKFPAIADRDEANTHPLKHILPALKKYDCLTYTTETRRRSPWVRAFNELYHPAGPWGPSHFGNAPISMPKPRDATTLKVIPSARLLVAKYGHSAPAAGIDSGIHRDLYQALQEYYSKETYFREFKSKCLKIAADEVNKPMAERADIAKLSLHRLTMEDGAAKTSDAPPPLTSWRPQKHESLHHQLLLRMAMRRKVAIASVETVTLAKWCNHSGQELVGLPNHSHNNNKTAQLPMPTAGAAAAWEVVAHPPPQLQP